ncbi:hypothetical protein EB796_013538 [Bugula neritina]|uniref:Uncharacterized protein n=1 Tax=Bugula neritina TaxID=10212 RepID=A0A7J7JQB1_BUGNE|nr:hypothetical protein EB796_013538 [Bugula neritina]
MLYGCMKLSHAREAGFLILLSKICYHNNRSVASLDLETFYIYNSDAYFEKFGCMLDGLHSIFTCVNT